MKTELQPRMRGISTNSHEQLKMDQGLMMQFQDQHKTIDQLVQSCEKTMDYEEMDSKKHLRTSRFIREDKDTRKEYVDNSKLNYELKAQ